SPRGRTGGGAQPSRGARDRWGDPRPGIARGRSVRVTDGDGSTRPGPHGGLMAVYEQSFGPSALATPANAVTITPLLLPTPRQMRTGAPASAGAAVRLGRILGLTDGNDGDPARRQGATRSGAFLDPLADKVLVLGAMIALVAADQLWWVPVAIIAAREIAI